MARITLGIDDLVVTSFITGTTAIAPGTGKLCTADISTCPRTDPLGGCYTLEAGTCQTEEWDCICTADISTCSRTSVEGGCDTSVQCVSVPAAGC